MTMKINKIYIVSIVSFCVLLLHMWCYYDNSIKAFLNFLFFLGFLGLFLTNIMFFIIPLFDAIGNKELYKIGDSEQELSKEEHLKEILDGKPTEEKEMPRWSKISVAVSLGLLIGSVSGFILTNIITRLGEK